MAIVKENMTADDIEKQIAELKSVADARRKEEDAQKITRRRMEDIDWDAEFARVLGAINAGLNMTDTNKKLDEILDILHRVTGPRQPSRDPAPNTQGQAQNPPDYQQSDSMAARSVSEAQQNAKKFNLLKWVAIAIGIVLIATVALYFLG